MYSSSLEEISLDAVQITLTYRLCKKIKSATTAWLKSRTQIRYNRHTCRKDTSVLLDYLAGEMPRENQDFLFWPPVCSGWLCRLAVYLQIQRCVCSLFISLVPFFVFPANGLIQCFPYLANLEKSIYQSITQVVSDDFTRLMPWSFYRFVYLFPLYQVVCVHVAVWWIDRERLCFLQVLDKISSPPV